MYKTFFSSEGFWQDKAIAMVRVIIGAFMIYHGTEVFDRIKMDEYGARFIADLKMQRALLMAYLGKGSEFVTGCLLLLGLFTRIASLVLAVLMLYITFHIGNGRFYMEDQHPFLFALFAFLFFFTGGGRWSLDRLFFDKRYPR